MADFPTTFDLRKNLALAREAVALLRSPGDRSLAALAALVVAAGLVPVASVAVTARVVDRLVPAVSSGGAAGTVAPLVLWAMVAGALLVLSEVVGAALAWVSSRHQERLKDGITARIHEQSARLDLAFYESPAFYDRLYRAREEASYRPAELCQAFVSVLQGAVTLAGLGAMLLAVGPWLVVVLAVGASPVLYVAVVQALEYRRWRREATSAGRRAWYYDYALTSADFAPELRMFGWSGRFREQYRDLRARLRGEELSLTRRHGRADVLAAAASLAVLGGGGAWIVRQAIVGAISLGQLAAFGQAFATGLSTMRSLLAGLGRFYANSLFIEDLTEFLAMEPTVVSPRLPVPAPGRLSKGIRFRDVTFHYPGTSTPALQGFDLFVPAGQRAAIVGPNGAGKSTIIKLLCRLYDPIEGAIEIDGVDIRAFDLAALRAMISPLFQDPVHYFQTAADNVRMGALAAGLTPADVRRAAQAAGADALIERLPSGYDTVLGKWFDEGTELSAGEWQRVALARALARPASIVVLDEPTSALDPWSEGHWYPRFCEATPGRTSLVITHRFTTAMQADVIHVVDRGRVMESGAHTSLLARGGRYAQAWRVTHGVSERPEALAVGL
jgi:ATP-binding cassette subfamily B protein